MIEAEFIAVAPECTERLRGDCAVSFFVVAILFHGSKVYRPVVAGGLSVSQFVVEDDLSIDALSISPERRRGKLQYPFPSKTLTDALNIGFS